MNPLPENVEEGNQQEEHIYESLDTLINVEICQSVTSSLPTK